MWTLISPITASCQLTTFMHNSARFDLLLPLELLFNKEKQYFLTYLGGKFHLIVVDIADCPFS